MYTISTPGGTIRNDGVIVPQVSTDAAYIAYAAWLAAGNGPTVVDEAVTGGPPDPQGRSLLGSFPGPTEAQVGSMRYYPRQTMAINTLTAWLSGAATTAVTAAVRKNGTVASTITISAASTTATQAVSITVLPTDYLTLDLQGGAGNDLTIRMDY